MTKADSAATTRERPLFRPPSAGVLFGVSLALILAAVGLGFGWRVHSQRALTRWIERNGGIFGTTAVGPVWLRDRFGRDWIEGVDRIDSVALPGATDSELKRIAGLSDLQALSLDSTQVTDEGLKHLSGFNSLQTLDLGSTRVTDEGLRHLAGHATLQWLRLDSTRVTDAGLRRLSGLSTLRTLSLDSTPVTDEGLKHLAGLTRLRVLCLNSTAVTDEGLRHLAGLSELQELYLGATRVTDAGVDEFKRHRQSCIVVRQAE